MCVAIFALELNPSIILSRSNKRLNLWLIGHPNVCDRFIDISRGSDGESRREPTAVNHCFQTSEGTVLSHGLRIDGRNETLGMN
jgi:hypothetical protein